MWQTIAGLVLTLAVMILVRPPGGGAATTTMLMRIDNEHYDGNWNYDFTDQGRWVAPEERRLHVDWGDALFFYNDASIGRIRSVLNWGSSGGTMYGLMTDGDAGDRFEPQGGHKTPPTCIGATVHIREYTGRNTAPGSDNDKQNYNPGMGFYVWATAHRDVAEGCPGQYFGHAEETENQVFGTFLGNGYPAYEDYGVLMNFEAPREEDGHHWDSDGRATYVNVK
jgi:hypothetical protein